MQECITLVVFTLFAIVAFMESIKWNNLVSYLFIGGAVYFAFRYLPRDAWIEVGL
jgi:uncharacterized protein